MSQINTESCSKDTMLLTIILPPSIKYSSRFQAAMFCFPHGTPQNILRQLQNRSILQSLTDCLEYSGAGLEKVAGRMAEDGCPDVEIFPVEMVGYYDLSVCSAEDCCGV